MNAALIIVIISIGLQATTLVVPYQTVELCEVGKEQLATGVHQTLRKGGMTQVAVSLTCTVTVEEDDKSLPK